MDAKRILVEVGEGTILRVSIPGIYSVKLEVLGAAGHSMSITLGNNETTELVRALSEANAHSRSHAPDPTHHKCQLNAGELGWTATQLASHFGSLNGPRPKPSSAS